MKSSQIVAIGYLSRCWMTPRDRAKLEYVNVGIHWNGGNAVRGGHDDYWIRRLWHKYAPQIKHLQKVERNRR